VPVTLLDTPALSPLKRDGATREFLSTVMDLDAVGHACPPESIHTRVRAWDLDHCRLNVTDGSWLRLALNRRTTMDAVAVATQVTGRTAKCQGERHHTFAPGEVGLTDLSAPFQCRTAEDFTSMWFRFSYAELCLPPEVIKSAAGHLATSPLYELFRTHLLDLYGLLGEDVAASAAESLGAATLELARAVIATVGQGDLTRSDAANEALVTRIEAFIQQHLADPALSPEGIASAHYISVRQLYKLWSDRELSLAEWIMRGRLEGARHDIAKDGSRGIAVVARRWGFADLTHFSRRFRAAYGLSPRDWRQHARSSRSRRPSASEDAREAVR